MLNSLVFVQRLSLRLVWGLVVFSILGALLPNIVYAATRQDVLVLVNANSTDSIALGEYYRTKRQVAPPALQLRVPYQNYISWDQFRSLRDQILKHMQSQLILPNGVNTATCTPGSTGPYAITQYYCQSVIEQVRTYTKIKYLVMIRGVPTRMTVDGSTLLNPTESTSVDNYLRFWLARYLTADVLLNFTERAKAFDNGQNMRGVIPKLDLEYVIGRIDGVDLNSAKKLIDRTLAAETNGIYGKYYGSTRLSDFRNFSTGQTIYPPPNGQNEQDGWRYAFGIFDEQQADCRDYSSTSHFLQFGQSDARGKTPEHCTVQFNKGGDETIPGGPNARQTKAVNALVYLGSLDGQTLEGGFNTLRNWRKNGNCNETECLPGVAGDACRASSTDPYRELNTACVGVAPGFIGYNHQSYPHISYGIWPTAWNRFDIGSEGDVPRVDNNQGQDNLSSLWFDTPDEVVNPSCYDYHDLSTPITCPSSRNIKFAQTIPTSALDPFSPPAYRVMLFTKGQAFDSTKTITVNLFFRYPKTGDCPPELETSGTICFKNINKNIQIPAGSTDWTRHIVSMIPPGLALNYNAIELRISSTLANSSAPSPSLGFDAISLTEMDTGSELLTNRSFDQGHKQTSAGDYAANFLDRLGGTAFWGSLSHHESNGHSFTVNALGKLAYFLRGLPLGDAVWLGEGRNSGILYGDPLYRPAATRIRSFGAYVNNPWNFAENQDDFFYQISTINGVDSNQGTESAATRYDVHYCSDPSQDFYVCDEGDMWQPIELDQPAANSVMPATWFKSTSVSGKQLLRLQIHRNDPTGAPQTFSDFYPVFFYDDTTDSDSDGVPDSIEITGAGRGYISDPTASDSDGDGLSDEQEICDSGICSYDPLNDTNPSSKDTDSDGMEDKWEIDFGLNPLFNDADLDKDSDGLSNLAEYNNSTHPNNPDTDGDGLTDHAEVTRYLTNPTNPLLDSRTEDTDGDKMSNINEVDIYGSAPTMPDPDGDNNGIADIWEAFYFNALPGYPACSNCGAIFDRDGDGVSNVIEFLRGTSPTDNTNKPMLKSLYVDANNGNDAFDGASGTPFRTLGKGIEAALDGDTVYLRTGIYDLGGAEGTGGFDYIFKAIQLIGPPNRSAEIQTSLLFGLGDLRWGKFHNLNMRFNSLVLAAGGEASRNIIFQNCHFYSNDAIRVTTGSQVTFSNTLHVYTGASTTSPAILIAGASRAVLINSTIVGYPVGVRLNGTSARLDLSNSILMNTNDLHAINGADLAAQVIRYNLIGNGDFNGTNGNITGDPQFKDSTNANVFLRDFHLKGASPAINQGSPGGISFIFEPAPNGSRIDMGAFGGTSEATPADGIDLIESSLGAPSKTSVPRGQTFTSTGQTKNIGVSGGSTAPPSKTGYFLCATTSCSGGTVIQLAGERAVPSLNSRASSNTETTTLTIPVNAAVGSYYLRACSDIGGELAEIDELNNCRHSGTKLSVTQ